MKKNIQTKHNIFYVYESININHEIRFFPMSYYPSTIPHVVYDKTAEEIIEQVKNWYPPEEKIQIKSKRLNGVLYIRFKGIDPRYTDSPVFHKWFAIK